MVRHLVLEVTHALFGFTEFLTTVLGSSPTARVNISRLPDWQPLAQSREASHQRIATFTGVSSSALSLFGHGFHASIGHNLHH